MQACVIETDRKVDKRKGAACLENRSAFRSVISAPWTCSRQITCGSALGTNSGTKPCIGSILASPVRRRTLTHTRQPFPVRCFVGHTSAFGNIAMTPTVAFMTHMRITFPTCIGLQRFGTVHTSIMCSRTCWLRFCPCDGSVCLQNHHGYNSAVQYEPSTLSHCAMCWWLCWKILNDWCCREVARHALNASWRWAGKRIVRHGFD